MDTNEKRSLKPSAALNPVPAAMVSCRGLAGEENITTISWTGMVNSDPPITYISIQPSRRSHDLIEESGEFVINLTTASLAAAADFCGTHSGRDTDKFEALSLHRLPAELVKCSLIAESPVNLECRVLDKRSFPSHDMFTAEIVAVHADSRFVNENGALQLDEAGFIAYSGRKYYELKPEPIGAFGYTIKERR